jgi:hypothetical protein
MTDTVRIADSPTQRRQQSSRLQSVLERIEIGGLSFHRPPGQDLNQPAYDQSIGSPAGPSVDGGK